MTLRTLSPLHLELLESRLAPAALGTLTFTNSSHNAHYTDVDGDLVTIKATSFPSGGGVFTSSLFEGVAVTSGHEQLQLLNLSAGGFENANITFTVVKVANGNGLANVGYINSTDHDIGKVTVKGDLGRINAGNSTTSTPGLNTLSVRSLGRLGTDTQGTGGNLESNITGALGTLKVTGDVKEAFVNVTGGPNGIIAIINIGGSLIGGSTANSGRISSEGSMVFGATIGGDVQGGSGPGTGVIQSGGNLGTVSGFFNTDVHIGGSLIGGTGLVSGALLSGGEMGLARIGHDVHGGEGARSGYIRSGGKLAGVSIGGSLIGGSLISGTAIESMHNFNGAILSVGDMGSVKIQHDLVGGSIAPVNSITSGSSNRSGAIDSLGRIGNVTIGGSVIGGSIAGPPPGFLYSNNYSGAIHSAVDMGAVKIGNDLTGGSITGSTELCRSGVVESSGRILSVRIGGSVISALEPSGGTLDSNASIRAGDNIGSLNVGGSLIGHAASPVIISARGKANNPASATTDLAIGPITIGGRVEFANILAGYNTSLAAVNGDAQIGAVKVGGDWVAGNLVAGAMNTASGNSNFGDGNDATIGAGSSSIIAKIASIKIAGQVVGSPDSSSTSDHFGFVAALIGTLTIDGNTFAHVAGASNDDLNVGGTSDMKLHEV